jgi:hypothetical protein
MKSCLLAPAQSNHGPLHRCRSRRLLGSPDMKHFNKSVLDALKPGGLFIVLDHAAAEGSGFARTDDLHRVDPAAVKAEVIAAGFEFVGESSVLRNSKDDHLSAAYNPAVRGTTDHFIYKLSCGTPTSVSGKRSSAVRCLHIDACRCARADHDQLVTRLDFRGRLPEAVGLGAAYDANDQ